MKIKLTCTITTMLLLLSMFVTYGQKPSFDFYYIVTLKGDIVRNVLSTYPQFAYFDFTYVQLSDSNYSLEGYAKDKDNNPLGDVIKFEPMTSHPPYRFKNLDMGHLYLDLATMKAHNVDGSENYVLTPRRCLDSSGHYVDYVSYRFSNKVEPSVGFYPAKAFSTALSAFNLNPSPPY